ncbi:UNVERIFIED_CONTAM: hypothetical protein PYX00_007733 [Menopon gallinae]|uniref:Dual specificity protein phosphatase 23 n=1 Tax=Menopon gallinae TaxID=328185 RepID=A0AAW2HKF3_9NEOP
MSEDRGSPPWNFYWVAKGELAGMAWPQSTDNIRYLIDRGIKHLVTLSPEKRPPVSDFPGMEWTEIPVAEFEAPTLDQIREFVAICERHRQRNQAVGVHCRQGRGRTGVMAACFLVRFQDLSPGTAITDIRIKLPGSIETREQERVVARYHDYIRGL